MGKKQVQIPADVHSLTQLLHELGYHSGAMKAYQIKNGIIDIWFIIKDSYKDIKRVTATLERGCTISGVTSKRRVYKNIVIKNQKDELIHLKDEDFIENGLYTPDDYMGF